MESEEPIVATYRNTYEVAVTGVLRQYEAFVTSRWARTVQFLGLIMVTIGLLYFHLVFNRPVTTNEKVTFVVSVLALLFLWFLAVQRGRWSFGRAIARVWFRWSRSSNKAVVLTIDDEAIVTHVEGEDGRYYQMWRGLEKVARTPEGFALWIPKHWSMGWIPLEAFKSEQDIARFTQLARTNVRKYVERLDQ
jgi:hypothetical protein